MQRRDFIRTTALAAGATMIPGSSLATLAPTQHIMGAQEFAQEIAEDLPHHIERYLTYRSMLRRIFAKPRAFNPELLSMGFCTGEIARIPGKELPSKLFGPSTSHIYSYHERDGAAQAWLYRKAGKSLRHPVETHDEVHLELSKLLERMENQFAYDLLVKMRPRLANYVHTIASYAYDEDMFLATVKSFDPLFQIVMSPELFEKVKHWKIFENTSFRHFLFSRLTATVKHPVTRNEMNIYTPPKGMLQANEIFFLKHPTEMGFFHIGKVQSEVVSLIGNVIGWKVGEEFHIEV